MDDHEGVDMTEHSGGHWLDTGEGPVSVDPPAGRAEVTPERAAYSAYLDHTTPCTTCNTVIWGCSEGKRLWAAYKAVRPIPGWGERHPA